MYDDNENFRLDDDEFDSPSQNIVDIIENGLEEEPESTIDVTTELDINRKNREGYEQLMKESATQLDGYWDINNPVIIELGEMTEGANIHVTSTNNSVIAKPQANYVISTTDAGYFKPDNAETHVVELVAGQLKFLTK